jgi:serralysin
VFDMPPILARPAAAHIPDWPDSSAAGSTMAPPIADRKRVEHGASLDLSNISGEAVMADRNERHYCVLMMPGKTEGAERAALLNESKWPANSEIRVKFLEGDPDLLKRVRSVAEEWVGTEMANVDLRFVDSGDADVRVAFAQGDGSWSYLGTTAQQIPVDQQTMNFGWLTPASDDDEVRRVVLHEFGHALGLIHEHQNPNTPIQWNRPAVIAALSGSPNFWDLATIEHNIFELYDSAAVTSTPTDKDSIMMYAIPATWTTDGFSADLNRDLSDTDREFIRSAYPW